VPAPHAAARRCGHCDRPLAECQQCALVLAWDGKPVAEGMDRAVRIDPHYRGEALASPRNLGTEMERLGYGTIVLYYSTPKGWR